ncbi:hypothetical protein QAD02_007208 [Eretmocerus hayati]|uniref:Uncharacterized protein n=1 Tax=Eretmocerus hayati TaxID=131215 RepID=A0ACC2N4C7_9HYME|nr:hypothetical protein QAD02_007208 [Eretmocerus hayati]
MNWNADMSKGGGLYTGLECGCGPLGPPRHWSADAAVQSGSTTVRLECGNHWNADASKEGWLRLSTLETGNSCKRPPSFWSADKAHGVAQSFDVGIADATISGGSAA